MIRTNNMKKFSEMFYESDHSKKIWETRGKEMQENFRFTVSILRDMLTSTQYDKRIVEKFWHKQRRLNWGYGALLMKVPSGFMTEACIDDILKGKQLNAGDHHYGVTNVAEEVRKTLEDSNFDIDYMVNEWLPKNFHLFSTVVTTKEEHLAKNISRSQNFTTEQKDRFEHYIGDVSPLIERKTKRQLLKENNAISIPLINKETTSQKVC